MSRTQQNVLKITTLVAAGLALVPCLAHAENDLPAKRRPNIVVILADDLGYGDLGCYGATKVTTPNLDRLAKEGMLFTDAHSPGTMCSPSRYGLLTGQYPFRNRAFSGGGALSAVAPLTIGLKQMTIASLAKSLGYATGVVGKWHLGLGLPPRVDYAGEIKGGPLDVGFDECFIYPVILPVAFNQSGIIVENRRVVNADPADPLRWEGPPGKFPNLVGGAKTRIAKKPECARLETEKAVAFVEKHKAEPFLLYFAPSNVHFPIVPGPDFVGKSDCGPYGDYVMELDWMVGQFLAALDRNGLAEQTLVLFSSDNGGAYYKSVVDMRRTLNAQAVAMGHRINGKLLGEKGELWEGGHRVPFIVRWPGTVRPGTQSDCLVSLVDVMATMTEFLNVPLAGDAGPDSISFLHALTGAPPPANRRESLVYQGNGGGFAVRKGSWVLIPKQGSKGNGVTILDPRNSMTFVEVGLTNSDYTADGKLKPDAPPGQLYDLASDLSQATNLYAAHPDRVTEMTTLLEKIIKNPRSRP